MNVYLIGMCVAMAIAMFASYIVSKRIKNVDDYYVAGRRAPVFLVAGSLVASYIGTGLFMGDAAMYYDGAFSTLIVVNTMASAGYLLGSVFFGRYLRRSQVLTVPEYFEKRFNSHAMRTLAAICSVVIMTVYMITVIKGISTLMHVVTGLSTTASSFIAVAIFTALTVLAGSSGVLLTDTMMSGLFTIITIIACIVIGVKAGGWFSSAETLMATPETSMYLSWQSQPGVIVNSGGENIIWSLATGLVWMSVTMVSPWQTSRYMMAKDESTVVRSAIPAAFGIFVLNLMVALSGTMVNMFHPELEDSSHVLIWAAMNVLPKLLGVLLLTGVMAAGISSATTFLSLIGSSVANDLVPHSENRIRLGRVAMIISSIIVLAYNLVSPPGLFWIMFMGGTTVCSTFMPVTMGSVLSKRLTKAGAFAGMLCGFVCCFGLEIGKNLFGLTLPVWLDSSIVGVVISILAMILVSAVTKVTPEEAAAREALFVLPEKEKNPAEQKKMLGWTKASILLGVVVALALLIAWGLPVLRFHA